MIDDLGNNVIFINKFPIRGACTENEDGSYTIFINAQLSTEQQLEVYLHELRHINNHDFQRHDVQEIEFEAHA